MHAGSGLHRPADRASPFEHTRAPCARSDLGSCSSADDGLARPSEAADDAERSERACRCYRRIGSSTLDGRGQQGVGCSCVAAIDVARQLCAAGQQAGLAATTAWRVAVPGKVRVSGAGMDPLRSEEASLDRMQGRRSRPAAGGATSGFGRIFEVRRGALAPPLRACIRLKQADSLLQVPIRTQYGLDCMGPATRHAVVAARPACWLAAQSCLTTSIAATQLQPTPCWPRPSKVDLHVRR